MIHPESRCEFCAKLDECRAVEFRLHGPHCFVVKDGEDSSDHLFAKIIIILAIAVLVLLLWPV